MALWDSLGLSIVVWTGSWARFAVILLFCWQLVADFHCFLLFRPLFGLWLLSWYVRLSLSLWFDSWIKVLLVYVLILFNFIDLLCVIVDSFWFAFPVKLWNYYVPNMFESLDLSHVVVSLCLNSLLWSSLNYQWL